MPTSYSQTPPGKQKQVNIRTQRTPKEVLRGNEIKWVAYVKEKRWQDKHLKPPETDINKQDDTTVRLLVFLNCILDFNTRVDLSKWLATRPPERLILLSQQTNLNLTQIRKPLDEVTWDIDIEEIRQEYEEELCC